MLQAKNQTTCFWSHQVSDERREQGTVQSVKEGFGFIRCADRDVRMFFHFSEWLDVTRPQEVGDECEFTVAPDPNQPGRLLATRIKRMPLGKHLLCSIIRQHKIFDPCISTRMAKLVPQQYFSS